MAENHAEDSSNVVFIDNVKLVNILSLELQLRSHILNYTTPSKTLGEKLRVTV